jgi:hypothetical protein
VDDAHYGGDYSQLVESGFREKSAGAHLQGVLRTQASDELPCRCGAAVILLLSFFSTSFRSSLGPSALSSLPLFSPRLSALLFHLGLPLLPGLLSLGLRRLDLLVPLDLGPLLVLLLPLQPYCLLLALRSGLIALNSPGPLLLPISVIMPAFPVLLKLSIGDPVIMPRVSVPVMASVVSSPARVDIKIETRNMIEVGPTSIIVMRAIPVAIPEAPPPAVMEK